MNTGNTYFIWRCMPRAKSFPSEGVSVFAGAGGMAKCPCNNWAAPARTASGKLNSPPCWNLTNASCSQIRYFASFSLDQILRCTDHNVNPAITYDYTPDGLLNYRGN